MGTLDWNKLILTTTFSIYYFFLYEETLFSQASNLSQTYFSQKHKTQNANSKFSQQSRKQFDVLLNTNQIKVYTYPDLPKENPLLRKYLNSKSTAYFLDETFYHTHILLFLTAISTAIVIKATKYSMYFIIHNWYDIVTKYSVISTEKNVNLSYLMVVLIRTMYISRLPACCQNTGNFCHWVIHLLTMCKT